MEIIVFLEVEPSNPPSFICHSPIPLQIVPYNVLQCALQPSIVIGRFPFTSNQCQPLTQTTSIVDAKLVVIDFDTPICSSPLPIASIIIHQEKNRGFQLWFQLRFNYILKLKTSLPIVKCFFQVKMMFSTTC